MKDLKAKIESLEQRLANEIGPHGGKILGRTESGKPIYDRHDHPAHKDYSPKDHQDASQLHQYIALANRRKPTVESHHWSQHEEHQKKVGAPHVAAEVGPKGGKIVGHTKSGKAIYDDPKHESHHHFSPDDHHEAHDLHGLTAHAALKSGNLPLAKKHSDSAHHHMRNSILKSKGFADTHNKDHKAIHKHQNGSEAHVYHDGSWAVHGPGKYHVQGQKNDHDRLETALGVVGD